ncbi:Sterol methyltransferase-like 3 [Cardamine amara subsp. amara]|uniref:Sterol methyltransferase-like 3 n=1 Tax=Cardamine amara subsp. amara TaxID=228776 RepID=A0ABD1BML1_CARAN
MLMMITQVYSSPSSVLSLLTYSSHRVIRASQDQHLHAETLKSHHLSSGSFSSYTSLCSCGRKHFLEAATPTMPFLPICSPNASRSKDVSETFHPQRPDWYKELFALFLSKGMQSYEAEIADYKRKLFHNLTGKAEKVLEIGVGTCPNLKYYASNENIYVFGIDPNHKMEKYACEAAREAGMKPENFRFMQGVGEAIPLDDDSVDAVVATLVLCSVSDVTQTLNEIKRVLKPGGIFVFIEHVAAKDGSFLRNVQNVLDPVQYVVADGCHLTRNTDLYISAAGFDGGTEINNAAIYSFPWIIRPHVYGVAYK